MTVPACEDTMPSVHTSASSRLRIAIIGANGQLGTDFMAAMADHELIALTHSDMDIAAAGSAREVLGRYQPQIVINTAAFNRVDECESYPDRGFLANAIGTYNLAMACRDLGAVLVHFSTDYVFDGAKTEPYVEEDHTFPANAYGISKLAGEHFVRYVLDRYFIIRTSGLYGKAGSRGKGGNFVEFMLQQAREGKPIRVVSDQTLAPTYTYDLAHKVREVIFQGECGLYHITSQGSCNWYQFARRIFEISGITADLRPITTVEYGAAARRPAYSVLENRKLRQTGIACMRPWDEALNAYLEGRRPE